jgi:hypothetical protein
MSNNKILTGKVAAVFNTRELAINVGSTAGVKAGMIFKVLGVATLTDPDNDEQLGFVKYEKGKVKIVTVEEKFSTARTFETYMTNIGGIGFEEDADVLDSIAETSAKFFSPPKWVTRVQTLKYDERGIDLPESTDKEFIYIKRGDIVEIDTESEIQAE